LSDVFGPRAAVAVRGVTHIDVVNLGRSRSRPHSGVSPQARSAISVWATIPIRSIPIRSIARVWRSFEEGHPAAPHRLHVVNTFHRSRPAKSVVSELACLSKASAHIVHEADRAGVPLGLENFPCSLVPYELPGGTTPCHHPPFGRRSSRPSHPDLGSTTTVSSDLAHIDLSRLHPRLLQTHRPTCNPRKPHRPGSALQVGIHGFCWHLPSCPAWATLSGEDSSRPPPPAICIEWAAMDR